MTGFNLNYSIFVKLTPRAVVVWKEWYEATYPGLEHPPLSDYQAKADAEGYTKFQGWQLMQIFGPHMGLLTPSMFGMAVMLDEAGVFKR